jgi:NAD(P)-dependent dehydrogenase (short-subunit alcohol dehydrogenase family)
MKGKIVLITGANSGIGKETAKALARQGATIYMVCRSRKRGENAKKEIIAYSKNPNVHVRLCDLASLGSIHEYGMNLRNELTHIDILINNAGALFGNRMMTLDGLEMTFALNHVGYFLNTHYLLDLVRKGTDKRIINVASVAHKSVSKIDFDDLQSEKKYAQMMVYGKSKLYNIYFTRELSRRVKDEGITVNCLHPGVVSTNFGNTANWYMRVAMPLGRKFMIGANKGAQSSVHLASSPKVEGITGKYFDKGKPSKPTRLGQNDQNALRIWESTMAITGLTEYGKVD